jgi:hypothetical protein
MSPHPLMEPPFSPYPAFEANASLEEEYESTPLAR